MAWVRGRSGTRPDRGASRKLTALQHMLDQACRVARIPARRLASIVGKIISMGLAIESFHDSQYVCGPGGQAIMV